MSGFGIVVRVFRFSRYGKICSGQEAFLNTPSVGPFPGEDEHYGGKGQEPALIIQGAHPRIAANQQIGKAGDGPVERGKDAEVLHQGWHGIDRDHDATHGRGRDNSGGSEGRRLFVGSANRTEPDTETAGS